MLGEFELFEISGCLKFIVSYFATSVRRKCLQGDNCEGAANLCFPVSRPMPFQNSHSNLIKSRQKLFNMVFLEYYFFLLSIFYHFIHWCFCFKVIKPIKQRTQIKLTWLAEEPLKQFLNIWGDINANLSQKKLMTPLFVYISKCKRQV